MQRRREALTSTPSAVAIGTASKIVGHRRARYAYPVHSPPDAAPAAEESAVRTMTDHPRGPTTMTQFSIFEPEGRAVPYTDEGSGPGVVLIPERGFEEGALSTIAHVLVEERFRVVRIGARRSADGGAVTLDDQVADALAVLDHVEIGGAWIGGHGSGGTVARAIAANHAGRANGLLLLGVEESDIPLAAGIPILIIQGSDDEVTPPSIGEAAYATAMDRASLKTVHGGGHLFPMTHAVETAMIVEDYLDWD